MFAKDTFVFISSLLFGYMWCWNYAFSMIFLSVFPKFHWVVRGTLAFAYEEIVSCFNNCACESEEKFVLV